MISSEVASVADAVQGIVSTISRANVRLRIFFLSANRSATNLFLLLLVTYSSLTEIKRLCTPI